MKNMFAFSEKHSTVWLELFSNKLIFRIFIYFCLCSYSYLNLRENAYLCTFYKLEMEIVIIAVLILLNGIFSMSEIALVSARKSRLESDIKKGSKSAKTALLLSNEPNKFLSTIQIGITLIGILTGLYSGEAFSRDFAKVIARIPALAPYSLVIATITIVLVVTYLTIVFGELVPKRLGLSLAEKISKAVSRPMLALSRLMTPMVWLLSKSTSAVMQILGIKGNAGKVTEEEIKTMVKEGLDSGEVQEMEHDIVERVFNLGDRDVDTVMTHRSDFVWLEVKDSREQIREKVKADMHDVYPVSAGTYDEIAGVAYLKDLFASLDSPDFSLEKLMRPVHYLPDNKSVYGALELFKHDNIKHGFVIDEYGSIKGIVTLTDIMEALVGEVLEEGEEKEIVVREDGSLLVDGQCSFYNFLEYFDMQDLYAENDYNTLGGLILELLEHIPQEGEKLSWRGLDFEILDMDGARIDKVLVTANVQS